MTNYQTDWVTELDKDMLAEDFLTVEGMSRFDQKWRPRMQALQQQGENVASSDLPYLLERKRYGLPTQEDMTRDEAYRTEKLDGAVYWFTFLRTWEDEAKSERARLLGLPASITVQVDARTGKIADATMSGLFFYEAYRAVWNVMRETSLVSIKARN